MTPDQRLDAAYAAMHAAYDADDYSPAAHAEVVRAEDAWLTGKTIAVVARTDDLTVFTFTDGTRMSVEGNVRSDLCDRCLNRLECEPLLFVREDVDCREQVGRVDA